MENIPNDTLMFTCSSANELNDMRYSAKRVNAKKLCIWYLVYAVLLLTLAVVYYEFSYYPNIDIYLIVYAAVCTACFFPIVLRPDNYARKQYLARRELYREMPVEAEIKFYNNCIITDSAFAHSLYRYDNITRVMLSNKRGLIIVQFNFKCYLLVKMPKKDSTALVVFLRGKATGARFRVAP